MDSNNKPVENPVAKAKIFSKLFVLWIIPLLCKGYKRTLNVDDLYNVHSEDNAEYAGSQLECLWKAEIDKSNETGKKPSLLKALIRNSRRDSLIIILVYIFSQCVVSIGQMVVLRLLILSFVGADHTRDWKPFVYAASLSFLAFLNTILIHPTLFFLLRLGMRLRVAVSTLIYQKCLRLSKSAQGLTNSGQIVNILSNDCTRFDISLNSLPYVITAPIQFGILLYLIYDQIGIAAFVGASLVVLLLPLQYFIGKYSAVFRSLVAEQTDQRGNVMNELIIGVKVIKQYVWEKLFAKMVDKIRKSELKALQKRGYLRGVHIAVVNFSPKVVQYMTFLAFLYLNSGAFTADKVFFTNTCLSTMIQVTVHFTPQAAAGVAELLVAIERIEKFLLLEEKVKHEDQQEQIYYIQPDLIPSEDYTKTKLSCVNVQLQNVSLTILGKNILKDVSFSVGSNTLVVVVGAVGSSKSSLLHAVLEELSISCGQLNKTGTISYASQEPWVFAGTVRENILFGLPFEKKRYSDVVHASALGDDFKQLPNGDMTSLGERGAALSGGQKARVNLARALYRDSDIYLLDDPLSAVDPRVSRQLFKNCVKGYLHHKLRILVTHQLQYLPEADYVIVLKDGSIISQGSYQQVLESGIEFLGLVNSGQSEEILSRRQSLLDEDQKIEELQRLELKCTEKQKTATDSEEAKSSGSVNLRTYYSYFVSGHSLFAFIFLLLVMILCQVFTSGSELWLSHWTNKEATQTSPGNDKQSNETFGPNTYYVYIFSGIIAAVIVTNIIRGIWFYTYCLKISATIHQKMFSSLIQAPMRFFEVNPSGRILNRFTRDVGTLDELLPPALRDTIIILLQFIGVIAVVLVSNYFLAVPTVVLMIAMYFLRKVFIVTARDLKRIESVTRSPVYTHVAQTMSGMITIRSCGAQKNLIHQFNRLQNTHTSAWFLFLAANRFFGIWLELISDTFLLIVSFSFLLLSTSVNAGNVGLAISSILSMMVSLQWGMQQSAETENYMTSVERALEYENLPCEETPSTEKIEKSSPPPGWPENGCISFNQVTLKYDKGSPPVLKNLCFKIIAGEKIGIVGRTGAGKSSITTALFRLVETEGDIFIDGVEAQDIQVCNWRSQISIVPQEPVLFSGTLRQNLDPFNEFTDMELWGMIKEVELKETVHSLDSLVSNGGENFSVGQRQLICLARALLRKNKILVLDEATASIDPKTDALIQHCINSHCKNCTVIIIAHRLHSVIDCDRVLVLENGVAIEFDRPHVLLQNVDGNFAKMVRQTGQQTSSLLRNVALEVHEGQSLGIGH